MQQECSDSKRDQQQAQGTQSGIDLKSGMDKNVKPGDDFYAYANGGWMKSDRDPGGPEQPRSVASNIPRPGSSEQHAKELIDGILQIESGRGQR